MITKIILLIACMSALSSATSITRDKIIIEESEPIAPHNDQVLGTSRVKLDGNCGNAECNLGNFIADAFVDWNAQRFDSEDAWTDAAVAIIESSAIKASLEKEGDGLTQENVDSCLSGEKIVIVEVTGAVLKTALEHSVNSYQRDKNHPEFLQFSGMNVVYDVNKPSGDRVVSVELLCADCTVPSLVELEAAKNYKILMQETLAKGSNGYTMFSDNIVKTIETTDVEMFIEYLKKKSPIYPAVEWRITVNGAVSTAAISLTLLVSSVALTLLTKF